MLLSLSLFLAGNIYIDYFANRWEASTGRHANIPASSLLTVGRTVDEAAFLFSSLDNACYSQLLADAAAATGVQKKIISDEVAKYTADAVQGAVRIPS